jgi:hypothetical protein
MVEKWLSQVRYFSKGIHREYQSSVRSWSEHRILFEMDPAQVEKMNASAPFELEVTLSGNSVPKKLTSAFPKTAEYLERKN